MKWTELIDRLAGLAGVEPWYFDLQGRRHETTLAAKVLVLGALGFDVSSIAAVRAAVSTMEEETWRRWLPPFIVQRAEENFVDLFLPSAELGRSWKYDIILETGETVGGEFQPQQLALLGRREIEGRALEHRRLEIPPLPIGYHKIRLASNASIESLLASVPERCHLPLGLTDPNERRWGVATHLYTVRSKRNWGVGDFGDLARLAETAGQAGASAVALNPFHALFPGFPDDASPYSPSSRLFLNPIYIDVAAAPFADASAELRDIEPALPALRDARLVDYAGVWQAKRAAFEALFRAFQKKGTRSALAAEFETFVATGGTALDSFAAFSALQEQHGRPWQRWPEVYRRPATPAVEGFVSQHKERIAFHRYLQFLADRQLKHAAASAAQAGTEIGLIRDLAMGINPDGADAWACQDAYIFALRCGAPPDDFHPHGQEWGVLPLHPLGLKRNFEPFIALLRANMRHGGGLRIDHVIGLQRQFLVPLNADPSAGCYVRYPLDELLGLLALESQRNQTVVVGEDLGTVPEGFRERMHEKNILGCAILYFERARDGGFKGPRDYRTQAAVSAATHDLPTLAGFWEGRDIEERRRIGIYDDAEADAALAERRRDCARLLDALRNAGLNAGDAADEMTPALRDAVHAFLASSSAQLFLAQLDDLAGEKEQINMPGTTTQYANWRRKLSRTLEGGSLSETLRELSRICAERGRGSG